ncbi:MAG: DNA primase [Candidatus Levybacteria bacterium]|nr:DNA primase [Candidatus Levybacteria bacterium]
MSSWIDKKYIGISGIQLRNFKWKSPNLANCSCPLCGDSNSNKLKARFYFCERGNSFFVYCHNCGVSISFKNFLKSYNPLLYDEYVKELYLEITPKEHQRDNLENVIMAPPKFIGASSILAGVKKISTLKYNHPARLYLDKRMMPTNIHYKLFYSPKFKLWINTLIPDKFDVGYDGPRLVIPFFDKNKNVYAIQGRTLTNEDPKYYSITLDNSYPKIYGLDTIDFKREYYIMEGPFDSMFINNSIAMGGSDFRIDENILPNIFTNGVVIYDNEPRNKEILHKMENILKRGVKIVIWPDSMKYKDINDMIMSGMTSDTIKDIIKDNIYTGLMGVTRLNFWRKI